MHFDQRDAMLAQMVDAFMTGDWLRYRRAVAWLRDYVDREKNTDRGLRRVGQRWYSPEAYEIWRERAQIGRAQARAKRLALTAATRAKERHPTCSIIDATRISARDTVAEG
jgi:hypothetical protein